MERLYTRSNNPLINRLNPFNTPSSLFFFCYYLFLCLMGWLVLLFYIHVSYYLYMICIHWRWILLICKALGLHCCFSSFLFFFSSPSFVHELLAAFMFCISTGKLQNGPLNGRFQSLPPQLHHANTNISRRSRK